MTDSASRWTASIAANCQIESRTIVPRPDASAQTKTGFHARGKMFGSISSDQRFEPVVRDEPSTDDDHGPQEQRDDAGEPRAAWRSRARIPVDEAASGARVVK